MKSNVQAVQGSVATHSSSSEASSRADAQSEKVTHAWSCDFAQQRALQVRQ